MDITISENLARLCNCYKSSGLHQTILDTAETANFKERYILGDQLGWGKFGIIRECSDRLTGEVLACKSISKERLVTEDDVRSVKLEIEIMTKLSGHENVVDLKAVYEEVDYVHLLMELCAGGELFHLIEKKGRFLENEARTVFKQLMEVVMFCHDTGVVHRDLKPENILLVSKSSLSPIKLADFGLATYINPGGTLHGTVGSPFYIAPEVLVGGYTQAADVWSAGVILYILLSGMPPFWGKTKSAIFDAVQDANLSFRSELWDHISDSAKELISRMLCVDPSKRLSSAQVLAHPWTNCTLPETQEYHKRDYFSCQELEFDGHSLSNLSLSRDQDFSFRDGSPLTVNGEQEDSPVFSCKSSFSTPLRNQTTPSSAIYSCKSDAPDFASPIPSMPSFTFFSPMTELENGRDSLCFRTKILDIYGDSSVEKLILSPEPTNATEHKLREGDHRSEVRHGAGTSVSSKTSSSLQSKRNNTISLGELDNLDLVATESIIRWASCTHISSASSLRSSLVC